MKIIILLASLLALSLSPIRAQSSLLLVQAVSATASEHTETVLFSSGETVQELHLVKDPIIDHSHIESAKIDDDGKNIVLVTLTEEGQKAFEDGIKNLQGKQIAIVVDGEVVSAPVLQSTSFGRILHISGNLSPAEASALARSLNKK